MFQTDDISAARPESSTGESTDSPCQNLEQSMAESHLYAKLNLNSANSQQGADNPGYLQTIPSHVRSV